MLDKFGRNINYMRVSITDRCNLRCLYCMPEEGISLMSHNEILSFDEIVAAIKVAVNLGIEKIRLTGGEPLVRKGVVDLVKMIAEIEGIKDFGLTTNGILLAEFAEPLKKAGLQRLNISLDSAIPEEYSKITRGGDVTKVFEGIEKALAAGFPPPKINTVIDNLPDEPNARSAAKFAAENGLPIRFIRRMDLEKGSFWQVNGGDGGKCDICNRLRLSANGTITPCLFSDIGFSIREFGAEQAIIMAINSKPEKGIMSKSHQFYNLGG